MSAYRAEGLTPARRLGLVLLWGLLLLPVLAWPWLLKAGLSWNDPLVLYSLGISLLWLAVFHGLSQRPARLHAWLMPVYAVVAIDLFLLVNFDARLTSGYIGIALSDHADAGEMTASYAGPIAAIALPVLAAYVTGLWLLRGLRQPRRPGLALAALVLLMLAYGAYVGRSMAHGAPLHRAIMDLAQKENSSPVGAFWQLALALDVQQEGRRAAEGRGAHRHGARVIDSNASPDVVVVVIGESSRPQNWSLFGYARDTTPLLRARRDSLIPLPDLMTTAPHTSVAVLSMLSLKPIEDWGAIQQQSSIVRAFGEAGFETVWLSTQPADSWGGLVPTVAGEASRRRYFDHQHDQILQEVLGAKLGSRRSGQRLFVVLHSKGSHFEFDRRYPPEFRRFAGEGDDRRARLVDAYDNSVLYTDWFLNQTIETLRASGLRAVMLYASDHGENLYDDARGYFGHALGTVYDIRTAGFIWVSDSWAERNLQRLQAIRVNATKPLSLADVAHSLLHASSATAIGLDPGRSWFSETYAPHLPRRFLVRGELRDEKLFPASKNGTSLNAQ